MGRGRQKAKQTKVARDLKYRSIDTDFASLERELRSKSVHEEADRAREEVPDNYADLVHRYDEDDVDTGLDDDQDERR
ncbi:Protein of unknown function [Propionibacterium cyclohexanicum]|uniref:DUF3073 domain-containing protein n=2 Tax=Propionibacterium cyclohexanicum TaxID=64702 RepID=A0A1H9T6X4_9ACTN|nr:DUF3073 domain-containing protein [Propionibacterium cyclohexanicum]SER92898.1 Protein of unknown function [Propionibacterium cyclohexanicum]